MKIAYLILLYLGLSAPTLGVKVNMEGTLRFGNDVIDMFTQFIEMTFSNSRRSLLPPAEEDAITGIVRSALVCRDAEICKKEKALVEEYIIILAKATEHVLENALGPKYKAIVFEKQVKYYLEVIKNIVVSKANEVYDWVDTLKKISAKFQELASIFESEINVENANKEKKEFQQKITIATVIIETNYLNTLCTDYDFCSKSYKVTNAVYTLLEALNTIAEEKTRSFIRNLHEALFETSFYMHMNEATAHKFQVLLNDMAYSKKTQVNELLKSLQKVVAERLDLLKSQKLVKLPHEVHLVHSILSDMDHIYSTEVDSPFADFLNNFYDFVKFDVQINSNMRKILSSIKDKLSLVSDDLFMKLNNEVRVCLEISMNS